MKSRKNIIGIVCLIVAVILPWLFNSTYYLSLFGQTLINIIIVFGLNFITGLTRNMNLGTAGIMAVGAYTSALLSTRLGISPWIGLAAAILVGFLISLLIFRLDRISRNNL